MNAPDFAHRWIADWNAHDLDAVLAHYADDVDFRSPKVARFTGGAKDRFAAREDLRPYFARAFELRPDLRFDLAHVCTDGAGVALVYANELGETAVETMDLNEAGEIVRARVFYG